MEIKHQINLKARIFYIFNICTKKTLFLFNNMFYILNEEHVVS
jgi:hypothetical protein